MAAGTFVNTTDYKITFTGGIEEEFLEYTQLVNAQIDPPLVHSISYGEYGGSYDNATDQRFSYELEKVNTTLRPLSFVGASPFHICKFR